RHTPDPRGSTRLQVKAGAGLGTDVRETNRVKQGGQTRARSHQDKSTEGDGLRSNTGKARRLPVGTDGVHKTASGKIFQAQGQQHKQKNRRDQDSRLSARLAKAEPLK